MNCPFCFIPQIAPVKSLLVDKITVVSEFSCSNCGAYLKMFMVAIGAPTKENYRVNRAVDKKEEEKKPVVVATAGFTQVDLTKL